MAARAIRRLRRVGRVPDSESDDDSVPAVQPIDLSDDDDNDDDEEGDAASLLGVHIPQEVPGARNPVEGILNSRGVRPRTEWLESCLNELVITHPGFAGLPVARQAELCFGQFLMADFNAAGAACLPPAMHSLHGTELPGPFVLQVDEVVDISHSLRDRYRENGAGYGRTLKLSITDGVQRVSGLEYRPIRALQVFSPAGIKISLKNVCVKRGLLMLVPEVLEILGGKVEDLEAARLRAVQVINKPPRGRRTRQGVEEPSLAEMVRRAAWSANSEGPAPSAETNRQPQQRESRAVPNNAPGARPSNTTREDVQQEAGGRTMEYPPMQSSGSVQASHFQQPTRGTRSSNTISDAGVHHPMREDVQQDTGGRRTMEYDQPVQSSGSARASHFQQPTRANDAPGQSAQASHFQQHSRATYVHQGATMFRNTHQSQPAQAGGQLEQVSHFQHSIRPPSVQQGEQRQPLQQDRFTNPNEQTFEVSVSYSVGLETRQQAGQLLQRSVELHQEVAVEKNGRPQSTPSSGRLSSPSPSRRLVQSKLQTKPQPQLVAEQPVQPNDAANVTTTPMDLDGSQESGQKTAATSCTPPSRVDFSNREGLPFTYLSVLKDRTNSQDGQIGVVRGKVKCVIVGVISFQYRDVDEFKLHIHVEDGSLITRASVQHQLVQRFVGYSPREVMSRLKDQYTRKEMMETMTQFQKLLERYEGLMEVEFSDTSSVPTVLQMTEGLQYEDVKLLSDRVHQSRSMQALGNNQGIPTIDLSTP